MATAPSDLKKQAAQVIATYAGLSVPRAEELVTAIVTAAEAEVLHSIAGSEPLPTAMVDLRALRLRHICEAAGRFLSRREVEVIFRLPASQAASVIRRMQATYAQSLDALLTATMGGVATVRKTGSSEDQRFEIFFDETAALEHAFQLLQRNGLARDVRIRRATQSLDAPRRVTDAAGQERRPLDLLGLKEPK